ncbi:MAG: isoaspartyl peptidase/L-asparaginase family protein [Saprospiraceae bacterium]
MSSRRKFLNDSIAGTLSLGFLGVNATVAASSENCATKTLPAKGVDKALVISTWNHGLVANAAAWKVISQGGRAIDAVEQGVKLVEADPKVTSVGYGGLPDRDGNVTLDACIMDEKGNGGAVCFLQHIKHPISVARKVMDETPHVILAGEGALRFALDNGFKKENLLTPGAKAAWEQWKTESEYKPIINVENHDTIGLLAMDQHGDISGACTTSGLAYKMHGRVGDSPILGAGLFVDNEVGGATATGMGEAVLKTLGSFLVVELMRQGRTPAEACKEAVMRIIKKQQYKDIQVGYIAINKEGAYGSYCIHPGFNYALLKSGKQGVMVDADYYKG